MDVDVDTDFDTDFEVDIDTLVDTEVDTDFEVDIDTLVDTEVEVLVLALERVLETDVVGVLTLVEVEVDTSGYGCSGTCACTGICL